MNLEARLSIELDRGLLAGYSRLRNGGYDELMGANGQVRPHWEAFLGALADLPPAERVQRAERLNSRVREMGIAHDIFADPTSPGKRWEVDFVPLILSSGEWHALEAALIQRARLLNTILADVYGEQKLLREGLIPPALLFSDPAFLNPCHGIAPSSGHLHFYAIDLARDVDGSWRVIDNHTETPAGVGYALANRVVHTHIAGDLFEASNGRRLAPFFQRVQTDLTLLTGRRDPRIALLTPGPHHDDYFSHAYLARYLGYLLVEGGDLRTAGDRVFLKTLEGLQRIDLIVRCVDGRQSDPLELDSARYGGPCGLVQACRKAPDLVRNALGSAVAQNRGLGAYLPAICQGMFGEDLLIADAPRWWLGDAANRQHVIANLDRMVIRQAQEGTGRPGGAQYGQLGSSLTEAQRQALKEEISLHGEALVAEERIGFGTTPAFTPQGLVPQPFAIRLFVASTTDGFMVMPGGLAMAIVPNLAVALSAPEARTRDVWVVADGEVPPHRSLWQPTIETARVQRSQRVIQSRVADDLFWLGRYTERSDWIMRVLRSALQPLRGDNAPRHLQGAARACLEALAMREGTQTVTPTDGDDAVAIERMVHLLMTAKDGRRTLDGTLDKLYRVANLTRDRLSLEAWRVLSHFRPGADWRRELAAAPPEALLDLIEDGLGWLAAFNGLMHENMTRNKGWQFLDMGRRVERAGNMSEAILWLFGHPLGRDEEAGRLFFLLEVADSFITYRSRYRLDPMLALVLDLLLLDETNPRSLAYQLASISQHLAAMPQAKQGASLTDERRIILSMLTSIRLADVEAFAKDSARSELQAAIRNQLRLLPQLTTAIERHYFNLLEEQPHRVHTRIEPQAMNYDVSHRTIYRYSTPVAQSQHIVHMSPRTIERQRVKGHALLIEPAPTIRTEREDVYGNRVVLFDIEQEHRELIIHARSTIGVTAPRAIDLAASMPWEAVVAAIADPKPGIDLEVARYACASKHTRSTAEIAAYARNFFPAGRPVLQGTWDLIASIYDDFTFDATATDISTPVTQVLHQRRGVCQDFSHLALACLRAMRLSARYVSGYILTSPPPGSPRLAGADASHAWISVWSPGFGWIDFDPTNGLIPRDGHISIAYGRDYDDVSPISGILLGGNDHTVYVGVDVVPVG